MEEILDVVAESGAAIEISGDPHRLDLEPYWTTKARRRDIKFVISTDAHSISDLENLRFGIGIARRAGVRKNEVLNTLAVTPFQDAVRPSNETAQFSRSLRTHLPTRPEEAAACRSSQKRAWLRERAP
jgi:DNA polymerase (family 10)